MSAGWRLPALLALLLGGLVLAGGARAASTRYCDPGASLGAVQQDRLLRFAGVIKDELARSGARLALVARSGLDLDWFGQRYSHAGISLLASPETPWAVRQLYFACDEGLPRLFDQGLSAFVFGADRPALSYVSVLLLPPDAAADLERTALDKPQALQLLGATYSANAYAFSDRYQNCNQWLAELLAAAWGGRPALDAARPWAQAWLREQGYAPTVFALGWPPLQWAAGLIPWLHSDDHPDEDLAALRYRVSMPASIETFVRTRLPGTTRLEFCVNEHHLVVHRGWDAVAEGCVPGAQDTVIALD